MRLWTLAMLPLLMAGCSCSPQPDPEPENTAAGLPAAAPARPAAQAVAVDPVALAAAQAQSEAMQQAVSQLHDYLGALGAGDRPRADALWSGGKPPPRADDHALRALDNLQALRIRNERPLPLDKQHPPAALEIPVRLRASLDDGQTRHLKGWYRLQRKVDGSGWEITSASLQPQLD
ncbi:hypothetical protein [Pseudoxanthomonas mexicana]|uniref:hypothetical protein n=1 Tax=Pseudoxanthomonas mexicana TaxID=128785 RepID=UPI00398BB361